MTLGHGSFTGLTVLARIWRYRHVDLSAQLVDAERMTVASALWAVGIFGLTAAPGRIGTMGMTTICQSLGIKEEKRARA